MAAALWAGVGPGAWWSAAAWQWRAAAIAGLVALGLVVYGGVLLALGFRIRDFSRRGA